MSTKSWTLDLAHSGIHFWVRHMVITKVHGQFRAFGGQISLDEADVTRSVVDVTIDAASIDTANEERDTHLRAPDFLDVERFPELRFRSVGIERAGQDALLVRGELTIRGITRPVTLETELLGRGLDPWGQERIGWSARTSIDRKEFGLVWNQALETGGLLVGDKVDLQLEVQAVPAQAQDSRAA